MERTAEEKARAVIANLQQMMIFAEAKQKSADGAGDGSYAAWYAQVETLKMAINVVRSEFGFPI